MTRNSLTRVHGLLAEVFLPLDNPLDIDEFCVKGKPSEE